ncbi:pilus assembly protein N-terminal domain-containing protein, partial [Candidatus Sumerlaeota bacterium]|nr:pilus assembly protein N-terminal domain-containing protein [Candidatus Sumerlaeota bacterium]
IKKAKADPKNYMILWVGKTTLPAYERISPTQLAELPAKIEDLKGVDVLVDKDEIKGRIPIYDIPPGVAIAQSMLAPKDAKSGISAGIPQGCVATTLTEEQLSGEVARLKIGDRIALIANVMQTSKKPPIAVTTVISKDAKVLQPLKTHRLSGATGGEQPRKPGGSSPQQLISSMMGKKDKGGKELTDIVLAMPLADSLRLAQLPPKTELRVLLLSGLPGEDVEKLFSEGMEKGSEGAASSTLPTPVPPAGMLARSEAQTDSQAQRLIIGRASVLSTDREVTRVAVGNERSLGVEVLSPKEILLVAKQVGQTNVFVWYKDGQYEEKSVIVEEDLSPLRNRLSEIDTQIIVDGGPQGEIILTGSVADYDKLQSALEVTSSYIEGVARDPRADLQPSGDRTQSSDVSAVSDESGPADEASANEKSEPIHQGSGTKVKYSRRIRNLLMVRNQPHESLLDRLLTEAHKADSSLSVRRVQSGTFPDDASDAFVVEGTVSSQAVYSQLLSILDKLLGGDGSDFKVVADDSGSLADLLGKDSASKLNGVRQGAGGLSSSSSGSDLRNNLKANPARASIVQTKNKRLVSFVRVLNFPQVLTAVRILELNRSKIREAGVDWSLALSHEKGFVPPAAFPSGILPPEIGANAINEAFLPDDRNVSSIRDGLFNNSLTVVSDQFLLNSTIRLLENRGYLKTLSEPNLLTLSGELASFIVGGQFPIKRVASTETAALEDVNFLEFGVRLSIRPVVADDETITMDVQPQVSSIAEVTKAGNPILDLTSLNTSVKLKSGEGVILGGLIVNEEREEKNLVPWLGDIPYLGRLFQHKTRSSGQRELALILLPQITNPKPRENFALEPPGGFLP